jgi:hypothetical protein
MTTATATAKGKAKAAPVTFDDIARDKMRETISEYRGLVARAANDERLTSDELARVLDLLTYMALPDFAFDRDIKAQREHTDSAAREAEGRKMMPEAEARAKATTERIKSLEDELRKLMEQRYRDVDVLPRKLIAYGQRKNELATLNPHLFLNIDDAVRLRIDAKNKSRPMPAEPIGWST